MSRGGVHHRPNQACHLFSVLHGQPQPSTEGPVKPSAPAVPFRIGTGGYPPRHTQSPIGGRQSPPSAGTQVPNPRLRRGIAFGSPIPAFGGDWRVDPQSRWGLCVSWVIQRCSSRNDSPSDSGRHSRCRRPDGYFYGRLRLAVQHREQVACSIWTAVHTAPPNLFWPLGNASND